MAKRSRKIWSIKNELLTKSIEAMLCAVQIFNNPNIIFKSESFFVLANISWTYLLHAYYRDNKIDYRYYEQKAQRKKFDKTKRGAFKYWELERCLNDKKCPLDKIPKANLLFLIGLRHEIEHQMTTRIDDFLSARFQACCLNYNHYIKKLFGDEFGIDKHLSFSLQFSSISDNHAKQLNEFSELPQNIGSYINDFDNSVSDDEFNNPQYSYRVLYVPKTANKKGQADKVIEFIPANTPEAEGLNKEYVLIKDREKPKYLPKQVVDKMKLKGYKKFGMQHHTKFWQSLNAKDEVKGFGVKVANTWYWYENWLQEVEQYCKRNENLFK
ncbi:MAG TPA: DUF3644 domain-containing protein [Saprospiraceae bacterium]|nr:DUF3644 domain-containing protein [Saprospiraceae bacterium]